MHVFVTHSSPVTKEKGDRRERGKSRREKGHSGTVAPGMRMFSISFPSRSSSGTQELFLRVSDALSFRGPVANGQERKGPDVPAPEVFAFEPLASFGGWRAQYVQRPICRLACGITGGCMDSPCVGRHQSFSNGMPDEHLKMKTSKNLTLVFQISTSLGFVGFITGTFVYPGVQQGSPGVVPKQPSHPRSWGVSLHTPSWICPVLFL